MSITNTHKLNGFTLLEILISIVILTVLIGSVLVLIRAGDRLKSRQLAILYATLLAENDTELIKSCSTEINQPQDAIYYKTVNGIKFEISRKIIQRKLSEEKATLASREIELRVKRPSDSSSLIILRLLQGTP